MQSPYKKRNISSYVRLYFLIVAQYIKARLQYRVDFFISSIGIIFQNITGFASLWILFYTIPEFQGWHYYELVFLYSFAILSVTPAQMFFDNTWQLSRHTREGTFIKYYFRPLNMMFYYMSEVIDLKAFTQFFFGVYFFIYSSIHLGIQWSFPLILQTLSLLFASSLIMISFLVISSSTSFWITQSFAIMSFLSRFREYARYPLTIFNSFFRFLFSFIIPIGFIAYYPAQLVLRPYQAKVLPYITPLVGSFFFALSYWVWSRGVRSWSGTGS
ncbi:MAG: ABC-2 family transporter protein [Breznakiellaceae bacterium]